MPVQRGKVHDQSLERQGDRSGTRRVERAEELLRFLVDLGDVAAVVSMMRWGMVSGEQAGGG
jgi:hypothetical protein